MRVGRPVYLLLGLVLASLGYAQNSNVLENRYFRSSITPSDTSRLQHAMFFDTQDHFIVQGLPLIDVISQVYGISKHQIVDGPDWIHDASLYDIEAVPPPAFVKSDNKQLLINLLADRFKLVVTPAVRTLPGQILRVARDDAPAFEFYADTPREGFKFMAEPGTDRAYMEFTFTGLADRLSGEMDQPVFDQTGLAGTYFYYIPDGSSRRFSFTYESLITPMGLSLQPGEMAVDVLEITRIEQPALDD